MRRLSNRSKGAPISRDLVQIRVTANSMSKAMRRIAFGFCWTVVMLPAASWAQTQPSAQTPAPAQAHAPTPGPRERLGLRDAPVTNVSVDGSEAMFTTMCALLAAGFEANVSSENWT